EQYQASSGAESAIIAAEKQADTPTGPKRNPATYERRTSGAITKPPFMLLTAEPDETSSHPSGLITPSASIAGASSRNTGTASTHFRPSTTGTMSWAATAQTTETGIVSDSTSA